MTPDIVDESRGTEPPGQSHGGPDSEDGRPQGHQRVAVEQRHRAVSHVVPIEAVHRGGPLANGGQAALGAPDGLGRAGGPRGEQQQVEVAGFGLGRVDDGAGRHRAMGLDGLFGGRIVDQHHPVIAETEVEPGHQRRPLGVGDEQLAVRASDVVGQRLTAPRGVDADDHGPGQGGATQPQQEVGNVPQQDAHVERPLATKLLQQRPPGGALVDDLPPAPLLVLEPETEAVVLGASDQQGGHGHRVGVGTHRPSSTSRLWIAVPTLPVTSHRVD